MVDEHEVETDPGEQGVLRPEHRPLLDALVKVHLKLHGGNPETSLAAIEEATTSDDVNAFSRGHFVAAAAEAMRRILVERAGRKKRLKRGPERAKCEIGRAHV